MKKSHNRHLRVAYDSTEPGNVPFHSLAIVYVNTDGSYAWTQEEVDRMRAVLGISESTDPGFAEFARIQAIEDHAGTPQSAPSFLRERRKLHGDDGIEYVNQSEWRQVEEIVINAGEDCDWFVAAPGMSLVDAQALRSPIKHKKPVLVQFEWGSVNDKSWVLDPNLKFTPAHEFKATKR